MKKIFVGFALSLAVLSFAQQYPNNGWNNDGYSNNDGYNSNDGYYNDQDDQTYFPDDYYYNYPSDYYPTDYYQNYYNDYRNSILNINWNVFFTQNRLSRWQIDQILQLNNLYVSFSSWNNFYRYNPDRWYYDRFYALQRIMGPRVFVTFRNNYYQGYSPIVYFQNYRKTYYAPRFRPVPQYRNVNINIYRVDRAGFRQNNPTLNVIRINRNNSGGFRGTDRNNSGFRGQANNGVRNNNSGGFRDNNNNNGIRNNGGFRGNTGNNNGGFRNNNEFRNNDGFRRNQEAVRENAPMRREENGGFRNGGGGFRQQRIENSTPRENNRGGNENRSGGFRQRLASN